MYFLLFWLLHDSLSDEIGYKTATFAGCEHSYQAPNRHREREKKNALPQFQLCCTGFLRLIYWSPTKQFMVLPRTHSTFLSMYSWTSLFSHPDWGRKERELLLSEPLKPIYYLLYHLKPVFVSLPFAFYYDLSFWLSFGVLRLTFSSSFLLFLLTYVAKIAILV